VLPGEANPAPASAGSRVRAGAHSGKGQEAQSSQTKPLWSDEEIETLRALYSDPLSRLHSDTTGVRFQCRTGQGAEFRSEKGGAPVVAGGKTCTEAIVRRCDRGLNPRARWVWRRVAVRSSSWSWRWIISDVWPVMYCGAPVVDSSSWCERHFQARLHAQW
jgi:hypothetical protein